MKNRKKRLSLIFGITAVALVVVAYYAITTIFNTNATNLNFNSLFNNVYDCEFRVHYLDVGKADSALIQCGDVDILIDAGDVDNNHFVCSYLKQQNVDDLELVIATHPDRDHIGQMEDVINTFDIDEFMMPNIPESAIPTDVTYLNMMDALNNKEVEVTSPEAGESISLGDITVEILAPINLADDTNGNSIVSKIMYKDKKFLFMGDADTAEEKDILSAGYDVKSDVLKIGHHGSKTSTSKEFLKAVNPNYAVISVGKDKNNLPKQETIDKLNEVGAKIYRTDLDGTIIMGTDGEDIIISTER